MVLLVSEHYLVVGGKANMVRLLHARKISLQSMISNTLLITCVVSHDYLYVFYDYEISLHFAYLSRVDAGIAPGRLFSVNAAGKSALSSKNVAASDGR